MTDAPNDNDNNADTGTSYQVAITGHKVDSAALLGGQKELLIQHQSDQYRLRVTLNGKLILTK